MAVELTAGGLAFLAGRLLFGGLLAFMGLNHFLDVGGMAGYAESKGIPAPRLGVVVSGLLLIVGGLSLALGAYPLVGAAAIVVFFAVTTPTMHAFWRSEDPQERQSELNDFLKNAALAGGALVLLGVGAASWPYALAV